MSLHVDSQVGRLRQVIVHQPGLELSRLTPGNVEELLFDDILWASRAREEHHAFVGKMRDKGLGSTSSVICSLRRCGSPRLVHLCWTGSSTTTPWGRLWCCRPGTWRRASTPTRWPRTWLAGFSNGI